MRITLIVAGLLMLPALIFALDFPQEARDMERPILFEEMEPWLLALDEEHDFITVTSEGQSVEGRAIYLVKLSHGTLDDPWRVYAIGVQHANEHSGKDAILFMINEIAKDPSLLDEETELYFVPMANPDSVRADRRRNANNADLNRDHTLLLQPETLALHRIQQRIRAHVVIDCHEYTRDGGHFMAAGIKKWPLMTLGAVNSPYIDPRIVELADARLQAAYDRFEGTEVTFLEYLVGGPPPDVELRPSTPGVDDARNGLGAHGSLSFIGEAGIFRRADDPQADFGPRVSAYRDLLWHLIEGGDRERERAAIEAARAADPPEFLPTNAFWGTTTRTAEVFQYPALDAETGEEIYVPTANYKRDLVIKGFVSAPASYAIHEDNAERYAALLDRHAIPYETLDADRRVLAEKSRLVRIEDDFDEVYERYGGRQIVSRQPAAEADLPPGSIVVPVRGIDGRRAAMLLEPSNLYGLYQFDEFREGVDDDGIVPVLRVMHE